MSPAALTEDAMTTIAASLPVASLHDYRTGNFIRPATSAEARASRKAAEIDGGAGVFAINGQPVYVEDGQVDIPRGAGNIRLQARIVGRTGANWNGDVEWDVERIGRRWALSIRVLGRFVYLVESVNFSTASAAWAYAATRGVTVDEFERAF